MVTRKELFFWLLVGGAVYYAAKAAFGLATIADIRTAADSVYWIAATLLAHWFLNRAVESPPSRGRG